MATYYWVGGSANWTTGNSSPWSFTSGGPGGYGPPSSVDKAIFDANSGSGTCTLSSSYVYCASLQVTANCSINLNGNTNGSPGILIYTDANFATILDLNRTVSGVSIGVYRSSTGAYYLSPRGYILKNFSVNGNFASTALYLSGGDLYCTGDVTISQTDGSFYTGGNNITGYTISTYAYGSAYIDLAGSVLQSFNSNISIYSLSASAYTNFYGAIFAQSSSSTVTFYALSSSTLVLNNPTVYANNLTFSGYPNISAGLYYVGGNLDVSANSVTSGSINVYKTQGGASQTFTFGTASNFNLLTSSTGTLVLNVSSGSFTTITLQNYQLSLQLATAISVANITLIGSSGAEVTVIGQTSPKTLTVTGGFSLNYVKWQNITAAGTIPFTGTNFTDLGGNTNITFPVPGAGLFFGSNF